MWVEYLSCTKNRTFGGTTYLCALAYSCHHYCCFFILSVPAHGKMVGRWRYFVFGALLLAAIISASLTCAFGVIEVEPGTMRQDSPIYGGDTILLSSANTFWYDEVVVHKAKGNTTDDHQVHLCSVLCDRLVANQRFSNFKSSSQHAIKNVILLEPTYFVSNSVVNITLTVFNVSSPSITLELYIFDRVSNYYAFQHEKTTPSDTIAHKVVGTAGYDPVTTQVLFTVPRTSYYFFGLNTSAPLTFRYSYEYLQLFYSYSDYTSADCPVQDDTNVCSLPLLPSTTINAPQTCILSYTTTHTGFGASPIYLTTELHRNLWNPLTITLLVLSTVAWLITCSICLSFCYCVCVRAGRKHGYTPIKG